MQVYATTTFEMKAKGSAYAPPVSSTSSSPSATANSSAAAASSTTTQTSAASDLVLSVQGLLSAVVGAGAIVGFF